MLNGWDRKVLYPREARHPIQAASDAKLFHTMVDLDVDYFSIWSLTNEALFGPVPVVSAEPPQSGPPHGGRRSPWPPPDPACPTTPRPRSTAWRGTTPPAGRAGCWSTTSATRNMSKGLRTLRSPSPMPPRLAGRHSPAGMGPGRGPRQLVEAPWQADRTQRGLTADSFAHSMWTFYLPGASCARPRTRSSGGHGRPAMPALRRSSPWSKRFKSGRTGRITWRGTLKPHAVVLYEVSPVRLAGRQPPPASPADKIARFGLPESPGGRGVPRSGRSPENFRAHTVELWPDRVKFIAEVCPSNHSGGTETWLSPRFRRN